MDNFITEETRLTVKRGAVWMDQNYPGWAQRINLSNLDMGDCEACIIGQTIGTYDNFEPEGFSWAVDHGFDVGAAASIETIILAYSNLESCWTEEVHNRRYEN